MKISDQQIEFINAHFHEGISGTELEKSKFQELNTSEELHYLSTYWNWDNGVKVLQWIIESPLCSEATALGIFWLTQPHDFQCYKLDMVLEDTIKNDILNLIKIILKNYTNNFYQKTTINFDPESYCENEFSIPDWIYEKTIGEESYIYYEEEDIEDWLDVDWENNIKRSKSAIELFNIAYFMNEPEQTDFILQHSFCDKGIAVLMFWRLHNECSIYTATNKKLKTIINDVLNNIYPEVLSYDPQMDEKVIYKKKKIAWEIPEIFREPIENINGIKDWH